MNHKETTHLSRRRFITHCSLLMAGGSTVMATMTRTKPSQDRPRLWAPLGDSEKKEIEKSEMARLIVQYPGKKLSCAESIFLAALKYLKKPEEWVSVAAGFGGGLGKGELCGLLTGGIMALGAAAGEYHDDRQSVVQYIRQTRNQYWAWWTRRSPIRCRDMRVQYNREGYFRMIRRVAARLERLIQFPNP